MKVLKFGGTSVGTIESLTNVKKIVDSLEEPGIIVVSALGGLTDGLIGTARMAASGDLDYRTNMRMMAQRHFDIINAMIPKERRSEIRHTVGEFLSQLEDIYMGISLIGDLPEKVLNRIVSFGERMSSIMVANMLADAGHADPLEFMKTKKEYGKDVLASQNTDELIRKKFSMPLERTVVTGGFISRDLYTGEITNLGRGGSDYTAALIAASLNAEGLEIWTDVNGFLTADPRIIKDARIIETMSYAESTALCEHGAKVIYPPTISPVCEKNIPIRVLNTHNPTAPGTLIGPESENNEYKVCGLSSIKNLGLISLEGPGINEDIVYEDVKEILKIHGIDTLSFKFSTPESFSLLINSKVGEIAKDVLTDKLDRYFREDKLSRVEFLRDMSLLTIVGHSFDTETEFRQQLYNILEQNGIHVYADDNRSEESVDYTSFVILESNIEKGLKLLHEQSFK